MGLATAKMGQHHPFADVDVEALLGQLTLEEKISLLTGQGSFKTTDLPEKGIPSITASVLRRASSVDRQCGSKANQHGDCRPPTDHMAFVASDNGHV